MKFLFFYLYLLSSNYTFGIEQPRNLDSTIILNFLYRMHNRLSFTINFLNYISLFDSYQKKEIHRVLSRIRNPSLFKEKINNTCNYNKLHEIANAINYEFSAYDSILNHAYKENNLTENGLIILEKIRNSIKTINNEEFKNIENIKNKIFSYLKNTHKPLTEDTRSLLSFSTSLLAPLFNQCAYQIYIDTDKLLQKLYLTQTNFSSHCIELIKLFWSTTFHSRINIIKSTYNKYIQEKQIAKNTIPLLEIDNNYAIYHSDKFLPLFLD